MMRKFWSSLRGQVILLIVAALLAAQAVSLWLFVDERSQAVRAAIGLEAAGRSANIARLIEEAPEALHSSILRAADSPMVQFELAATPLVEHRDHDGNGTIGRQIRALVGDDFTREIRVELHRVGTDQMMMRDMSSGMMTMHKSMMQGQISEMEMRLSISLQSGQWLNVGTRYHQPPMQWPWMSALAFGGTAAAVLIVALWVLLTRLTGPLRALSVAAERLGRGEESAALVPAGPTEVRDLTGAFNRMQARLTRFVSERTRLLAALGHDLRSPLTAIRVRAEMVEDDETRERIVASVEEMQEMVDATLSFARGMATGEASQTVDLGACLDELCGELRETGCALTLEPTAGLAVRIRPTALRRALRNVIENAVRYGGSADIRLSRTGTSALIQIDDNGPGIPQDALERVFEPFVRLEVSRSRETGGTGLGLSIARSIVQAHGGEIGLENRAGGGLSATVELPLEPTD
ncbi:ATP-binding protein [Candidatus Halocynthiibacter alkanivorans]|uniref:ATP-binding protein n=1 Tax=Candidatus Halocynthiibacter alkanivorans TaxID=2267619 RepID=UPI00190F3F26|nr:ATP-binding protein [Candidatus Halocynthiibacter alkanivorans]